MQRGVLDRGGVALALSESAEGLASPTPGTTGTATAGGDTGTDQQGVVAQTSGQQNTGQQATGVTAAQDDQTSASQQVSDGGQGSGQQGATTAGGGASSAAGASDTFSFVEVFRTPDGEFQTVTVIGDDIPVGSEVVDIRPASAGETPDITAFSGEQAAVQEAMSPPEWFI